MTPQELKNSILQLAIQGRLVEQRPEEGTAAELLEKIFAAKNAKDAKKGSRATSAKSAKESRLASNVSRPVEDAPFDIPDSWEWVRLGEVFQHNTGKALNSSEKTGTPLSYITTSNVYWNRFELGKLKTMLFSDSEVEKCTVRKGDLLVLEGGDVGRAAIWNYAFPVRIQNHIHRLRPLVDICVQYIYYIFMLYKGVNMINGKGISIKGLSANSLHNLLIPLPPLAEQKRIVAKIEELLPLIDRYEKAWSRLEDFNKRFPVDMQKSLLQLAIQGKLVEQRAEEGTGEELYCQIQAEKQRLIKSGKIKKEKPLPAITEDEIPFDIPDSWKWVRLGQLGNTNIGLTYGPKDVCDEGVVVLRSSNIQNGKMDYADIVKVSCSIPESKMCHVGDILICARNGSKRLVGKAALIDRDGMSFGAFMAIFRSCCNAYVLYVINSAYFRNALLGDTGTTTINQITQDVMKNMLIPLPPLAEQKRIVAKLEELLPLCERLK